MYYCNMCNQPFDRPTLITDYEGRRVYTVEDGSEVCPHCGGDNYTEALRCRRCGEWRPWTEFDEHDFCETCMEEVTGHLEDIFTFDCPETESQSARDCLEIEIKTWLNEHF